MKKTSLRYGIFAVFFLLIASSAFTQQNFYVNDNSTTGDIYTSAIGNNTNAGTVVSPFATISYAVSQAQPGDVIWIDAGTYAGQVFLDKAITLQGASAGTTIINAGISTPASLPNVPTAVIYSASAIGDIFIKGLTVNSGSFSNAGFYYGIALQTGGEISNCEINGSQTGLNVGNGIHVNKEDPDAEAIAILNNHFHHIAFIAIKFNVPHITATINNNTIDVTGSGYGMGLVGGGEPHLIDGLVFTGNKLIGLTGYGVKVHCNNSNVTISNNSFEEGANAFTTTPFIQNYSEHSVNASCNWLGSADFEIVRRRIQGNNVGYGPWLTNGTDNSSELGFQPLTGVCNGRQNKFYVNDNDQAGDVFTTAIGNNSNNGTSTAPYATVNHALSQTQAGDTIYVDAGLYAEDIVVNKSITIKGVQAGINPGTLLSRGAESIIVPGTNDPVFGTIINIQASDITIDGITIDGDNPAINGTVTLNGVDINKGHGITRGANTLVAHNNLVFKNNIIKNFYRYGIFIQSTNTLPLSGNLITKNHFDNIPAVTVDGNAGRQGRAVGLANNGYATIAQNIFTKVHTAIWINGGFSAPGLTNCSITGNFIKSYLGGISIGGFSGAASAYLINNNSVTVEDLASWNVPGASIENFNTGIFINNVTSTAGMSISNNTITNTYEGLALGRFSSPNWVVSGNTISGSKEIGLYYFNNSATNPLIHFQNNTLVDNDTAIYIHYLGGGTMPVTFSNNTITGGNVGLHLDGTQISVLGDALMGLSFTGLSGNYIQLTRNALNGQTIDASMLSFENKVAGDMSLAELFAVENKVAHRIDYNGVGFIKIKPHSAFVTTSSFSSTLTTGWGTPTTTPDINRSVAAAAEGDSLYIAAGTYSNQVTLDKGLSLIGEGKDVTLLIPPALPYSAPPGPFTEKGLIQTAQNIGDVHIRDLSASGDHSNGFAAIIIQSGGSIRNCNIQNGSQGIFFRVEAAAKTAVVENNVISAEYIALNFQGGALTASMINNSITVLNPGFSAGVFVGLDFGPLPQFTVTGNSITGFTYGGIFGGSSNGIISQNSIIGTGPSIWQVSGGLLQANCNWFGTSNAELIAPKISGNVSYTPWLSNGTDNSGDIGFQPIENICGGRQNKFYVNDNSQSGDVFTTAIGNNSNNGFSSAPFATLEYAHSIAQAGDTIFVDAGTYATPNLTITKAITILGSNYNSSPNNPADRLVLNPVRNANTSITGSTFTIASNDVRLEGLTFNPGARSQVTMSGAGVSNFIFKRNYSIVSSGNFLNLNGPSIPNGQASTFGNYLIDDNRFESQVTVNSLCIVIGALNDVTVNNNTFFTPASSAQRLLTSCATGNGGLTVNHIYSNNISNAARNEWFSSGTLASARIENNISLNGQRSLVLQTNISTSSDIQVRNNYIESNVADLSPIQYLRTGTPSPGAQANLLIENNTIIQNPMGRTSVPAGILAQHFFTGVNGSVTIRRNKISFTGDYSSFTSSGVHGLSFTGNWQNIVAEENEIAFNGTNLTNVIPVSGLSSSGISISSDNGVNTIPGTAVVSIAGNKINGFRNSFAVHDGTSLAPNTYVGYGNLPAGVNASINNNGFTNDLISINNGDVGQPVNANCNWYGSAAAQVVATKVSNGSVVYSTWLTNGTDSDIPATGFQPMTGSCNGTPVTVALGSKSNVTCLGANNGSIAINISGGSPAYTIAWTKDEEVFSSNEDLTGLAPGTYSVTITDASGSVATIGDIVISEPLLLTASASGSHVSCFGGSNGTASVTAEGGTAPYTYLWSNGATTESISGLIAGNYIVTISDANGCTASANYQVTQLTLLTTTTTPSSTSCFNSITVTANGGTIPYTYLWSNGATTSTISSIAAGTYSVTVTDANGCVANASATVTANEAFNPSASVVDVNCFGTSTGSITVTNVNAVAPFQYSIDGGLTYQGSATFSGLTAGTYTITVKDFNGCTGFVTKTIAQPVQLVASFVSKQNTCFGQSTGAISVNVTGGTSGYSYSWSGPAGYTSTQKNISGLAAGSYNFIVTDARGCTASLLNVNLTAATQILSDSVVTNIACKGETNGSIAVNPTGGSGNGFNYLWSTGSTSNSIVNLGVGNYNVTITDRENGCSINRGFTITQPSTFINLSVAKTNATGCSSLGTITATGSGGAPGYQYKLNTGPYQSSGSFTGLYAGSYTVWVKDQNGCTKSSVVSITDNGGDEYEGNNSKNQAKAINTNTDVFARLAIANDAADWFKFTPTVSGNYILSLIHPSASFTFNLYATGNNTPALVPTTTTATTKQYGLVANNTYYISITGGLSYECYMLNVTAPSFLTRSSSPEQPAKEKTDEVFDVKVLGNPSHEQFSIVVNSSGTGKIKMRIVDVSGRVIDVKENLQPGQVIRIGEKYRIGAYFAEIRQGDKIKTVRLVKL